MQDVLLRPTSALIVIMHYPNCLLSPNIYSSNLRKVIHFSFSSLSRSLSSVEEFYCLLKVWSDHEGSYLTKVKDDYSANCEDFEDSHSTLRRVVQVDTFRFPFVIADLSNLQ